MIYYIFRVSLPPELLFEVRSIQHSEPDIISRLRGLPPKQTHPRSIPDGNPYNRASCPYKRARRTRRLQLRIIYIEKKRRWPVCLIAYWPLFYHLLIYYLHMNRLFNLLLIGVLMAFASCSKDTDCSTCSNVSGTYQVLSTTVAQPDPDAIVFQASDEISFFPDKSFSLVRNGVSMLFSASWHQTADHLYVIELADGTSFRMICISSSDDSLTFLYTPICSNTYGASINIRKS